MSDYKNLTAVEISEQVRSGKLRAVDLAKEALRLAGTEGKELNAFITLCEEKALAQAKAVDEVVKSGKASNLPLAGVPIAIKDNISYTDYPCTCASHILDKYVPPYDATVVTRLVDAGAVIIGKTNMDEFAMGSSNENSYYGPVKNPVRHDLAPGGSSGGSAAVVAQRIVPLAFGSETGGSVRQPASFCGVYGLKPSYGGISRYGLVAFASSTDQISPFANSIEDLALVYSAVCGRDSNDSTSVAFDHPNYASALKTEKKFRFGIPKEYFAKGLEPEVGDVVQRAIDSLKKEGHSFIEISLPMTQMAIPIYYIVASAEASANLARFDGVKYGLRESRDKSLAQMYGDTRAKGFGREVKRRIMLGTYVLSSGYYDAYYIKASKVRELMRREYEEAFKTVDMIISPTAPTPAFKLGEKISDPLAMYLSDVYTAPANLAGIPAISVPFGVSRDGRPIGVQFIAGYMNETALFQVSKIVADIQ
ncbi:MAG: Asp-tRNA(Asn)/Glu-tRNA(Gln) amidotransferase subunit GatA [candidate division Zixibacteria bacterium]|nr:Asp-tRNA(Asn)/Glu-tRNA(Gln) amidotransferase subunit GatA [candidate division Zixibacteria bacterium]